MLIKQTIKKKCVKQNRNLEYYKLGILQLVLKSLV